MSFVATIQSQESIVLENDEQSQVNRLIEEAVDRAEDNNEDSELIANIITKSDISVITDVVNLIQKTEEDDGETNISLKVLSSIVLIQTDESIVLDTEEQTQVNRLIKEAIERAAGEQDNELLENIIDNDENVVQEIISIIEEETSQSEAPETDDETSQSTDDEAAPETDDESEEGEENTPQYDANGFSTTTPFLHRDTATQYDSDGYNSEGFNDEGYNKKGDYNEIYDTNVSEN